MTDLANAAGCDRTLFSQTLNSKVHLSPDHALGISEFLGMSEGEQEYFLTNLLHDRASRASSRAILKRKMIKLTKEDQVLNKKVVSQERLDELSVKQREAYYSSWLVSAAHILTSIAEFRTVEAVARRLSISNQQAHNILENLRNLGIVQHNESGYAHKGTNLHGLATSAFTVLHHHQWRAKAMEFAQSGESIHYTNVFSLSREDWPKLKRILLDFIEKKRQFVHNSGADDIYCFCCDLFSP